VAFGMQNGGTSTLSIRAILAGMSQLGLDTRRIYRLAGIGGEQLSEDASYVGDTAVSKLWRIADRDWSQGGIGLHAGARVPAGAYGVLEYLISNAATLGAGARELAQYSSLINSGTHLEIESAGRGHTVRLRFDAPCFGHDLQRRDYWVSSIVGFMFRLTSVRPVAVSFSGSPMATLEEYERVLDCRPGFDSESTEFTFSRDGWEAPILGHDPVLSGVLRSYAAILLARTPRDKDLEASLIFEIQSSLRGRAPRIDLVARRLGMSVRSLQRRLAERGIHFGELVDRIRRDAAARYLEESDLSISEVAYELGYSGPAAFHRAFKRWTGATPRCRPTPRSRSSAGLAMPRSNPNPSSVS
jgi:AraC-like DNA-binding protein